MHSDEFKSHAHRLVEWMGDYLAGIESFPVKAQVRPGEILGQLPGVAPREGEAFERIFADFEKIIIPGITHWQHPSFFAYFPANSSPVSVLAEMLTATMGVQAMIWQTSPAAAELEERVMKWLADMIGLPAPFAGVIQDTASTATLCSLLTARERHSAFRTNRTGLGGCETFTCYSSSEAHSSVEKAVKIAGVGSENLRKIAVDRDFALVPQELERAIRRDIDRKLTPLWVVATLGTTGSTAVDPLKAIASICGQYGVWLHVDAALAGTALILPEMRWMSEGIDRVDSLVFNPHKWMFTNFDCSAYFVKDPGALIQTFEILPEYLKTRESDRVNNYRDWGIPLGRRFRALKLWFVIRQFGVEGLQEKIRGHLRLAGEWAKKITVSGDFELLAPVPLNTLCFRFHPRGVDDPVRLNTLNTELLEKLNGSGKLYMTHTKLDGAFTLRLVVGQTNVEERHVAAAWERIQDTARKMFLTAP